MKKEITNIEMNKIIEPALSLRNISEEQKIDELAKSIKQFDLIHPITVVQRNDKFEIVAGYRRFKACNKLNYETIPAIIVEEIEEKIIGLRFTENIARKDNTPVEEAEYIAKYIQLTNKSQKELAAVLNVSEAYISERLAIINYNDELKEALQKGKITFSVARELNKIKNQEVMLNYLYYAINNGCTPETARAWRMQAEATNVAIDNESQESEQGADNFEQSEIQVMRKCDVCGSLQHVRGLHTMLICYNCIWQPD